MFNYELHVLDLNINIVTHTINAKVCEDVWKKFENNGVDEGRSASELEHYIIFPMCVYIMNNSILDKMSNILCT